MSVDIFCLENDSKVYIQIDGEAWDDLKNFCSFHKLRFSAKYKAYHTSASYIVDAQLINAFIDFGEDVHINRDDLKKIERLSLRIPDLVRVRMKYKEDITKYPILFDFQKIDIQKIINQNRVYNAIETGLGKTYEHIAGYNHYVDAGMVDKLVLVVMNNKPYTWELELLKFSPYLKKEEILIVNSDQRYLFDTEEIFEEKSYKQLLKRMEKEEKKSGIKGESQRKILFKKRYRNFINENTDKALVDLSKIKVIIFTYDSIVSVSEYYAWMNKKNGIMRLRSEVVPISKWIKDPLKAMIILDEAHMVKSRKSTYFKSLKWIAPHFEYRGFLSFTPNPKDILDLWSQFYLLDVNVLGDDYFAFARTVCEVGNKYSEYAIGKFYPEKVEVFVKKIAPYFIRRFKKDEDIDLPDFNFETIYVKPTLQQKTIYQKVVAHELKVLKEEHGTLVPRKVQSKFPYLTLVCSDPSLLQGKFVEDNSLFSLINNWNIRDNAKLPVCEDLIKEALDKDSTNKVVIWSTHPKTCDIFSEHFTKKGIVNTVIHGETKIPRGEDKNKYRNKLVREFRSSKDIQLAFLQPMMLGTGEDIPEAGLQIVFDRNYNANTFIQTKGRGHRATSKRDIDFYLLILGETLEVAQDVILDNRVNLNSNLFNRDSLTMEEWKAIFNGNVDETKLIWKRST